MKTLENQKWHWTKMGERDSGKIRLVKADW